MQNSSRKLQSPAGTEATTNSITTSTQRDAELLSKFHQRIQILKLHQPLWNIIVEPSTERFTQRWIGSLTIGVPSGEDIVEAIPEPGTDATGMGLPSKKDVKELLAQRAWPKLEAMSISAGSKTKGQQNPSAQSSGNGNDGINWIGCILEYNNSLPMQHRHMVWTETSTMPANAIGPVLFGANLSLAVHAPDTGEDEYGRPPFVELIFPSTNEVELFSSKKQAKQHCSRLACQALIKRGLLRDDGSLLPKQKSSVPAIQMPKGESGVADLPKACQDLGLSPPRYEYSSPSGDPDNPFVDCAALFPPTTGLPVPFVTVRNVYGKKQAKDECARLLMDQLPKIREWRLRGGIWTD